MDPENLLLLFSGSWSGNSSGIARLKFTVAHVMKEEDPVDSASAEPDSEQPRSSVRATAVLYAVNEEATVAVLDGTTGDCLRPGPRQPEVSSKTLYMDLLGQQLPSKPHLKYPLRILVFFPILVSEGLVEYAALLIFLMLGGTRMSVDS